MGIEELSELIQQHGRVLYGFCYRLTGNKADTDGRSVSGDLP